MLTRLTTSLGELGLTVPKDHPLRSALDVLHTMTDSDKCNLPNDVQNPFGRTWTALIHGEDRAFATQAWKAATLLLVQRSLRNGSVHIPDSRNWRAPDNHMIPLPLWNRDRRSFIRRMGLEQTAGAYLKRLEPRLTSALMDLDDAVAAGMIGIDKGRFRIPRRPRADIDAGVGKTRDALLARVGSAQLPDVIMDTDRAAGLTPILLGRQARSPREQLQRDCQVVDAIAMR